MEIIVYSAVVGILAIISSILAAKLCGKEREIEELKNSVRRLREESIRDHRMYVEEKTEVIMLRPENGKLRRELFKVWRIKNEGEF